MENRGITMIPLTRETLERKFEEAFMKDRFDLIFPKEGYKEIVNVFLGGILTEPYVAELAGSEKAKKRQYVWEHADEIVKGLPLFQTFEEMGRQIKEDNRQPTDSGSQKRYNSFITAFCKMRKIALENGVSKEFVDTYWQDVVDYKDEVEKYKGLFKFYVDEQGFLRTTIWYKTAYYFSKTEKYRVIANLGNENNNHRLTFKLYTEQKEGYGYQSLYQHLLYTDGEKKRAIVDENEWFGVSQTKFEFDEKDEITREMYMQAQCPYTWTGR